jgi:putative ABC transport system substrate-binding protein
MKRRRFVALLAAALGPPWPAARAQPAAAVRRIGLMIINREGDPEGDARVEAFRGAMRALGRVEGRDFRIDIRWGANDAARAQAAAEELLKAAPDVIVVNGSPGVAALQRATKTVPVVFVVVTDPLGSGYVASLARPGANITGFSTFSPEIGGKWLGLLKEISPGLRQVGCVLDPGFKGFAEIRHAMEAAAPTLGLTVTSIDFRVAGDDLESAVARFAASPNRGLVVAPTALNNASRDRIIALAARFRLPAIYPFAEFAIGGGLLAYGFDPRDLFARGAGYVDRILRGERPGDLPVQAPTKFEMIVNLRTAKAMDLRIPAQFLARADRVID